MLQAQKTFMRGGVLFSFIWCPIVKQGKGKGSERELEDRGEG